MPAPLGKAFALQGAHLLWKYDSVVLKVSLRVL